MSERVTIDAGQKVRIAGQTYQATDTAVIDAALTPTRMQKNRHAALECADDDCLAWQRTVLNGRVITMRTTAGPIAKCNKALGRDVEKLGGCAVCDGPLKWRESADDNDQGEE